LRKSGIPNVKRYPKEPEWEENNSDGSSSEDGEARSPFRPKERTHLDFKVDIPKFKG